MKQEKRIVVLGGGNGTSRLLSSLKPLFTEGVISSLYAVVNTSDDGGSTGRLRTQYDVGSMGDLTKSMMALSNLWGDQRGEELLKALNYRFAHGDFQGHTLRNILLTVFELTSGNTDSALAILARLLQIPQQSGVVPTTMRPLTQLVEIDIDGQRSVLGEGEHFIAHKVNLQIDPDWKPGDVRVTFKEHNVPLNERAAEVIASATHILIAPGHTFGTILPTLASPGLADAIQKSDAELWVVMTLLSTPRQTSGWSGEDFVRVYESYVGRPFHTVIANTAHPEVPLVEQQSWVHFAESEHAYRLISEPLAVSEAVSVQAGDTVPRAIVVHDHTVIEQTFRRLLAE